MKKNIFVLSATFIIVAALSLKANAIEEDSNRGKCEALPVKIFGFTILKKYNRDCPLSKLPDGRWDWFPKQH